MSFLLYREFKIRRKRRSLEKFEKVNFHGQQNYICISDLFYRLSVELSIVFRLTGPVKGRHDPFTEFIRVDPVRPPVPKLLRSCSQKEGRKREQATPRTHEWRPLGRSERFHLEYRADPRSSRRFITITQKGSHMYISSSKH